MMNIQMSRTKRGDSVCVEFIREDGRKNNVYLSDAEVIELARTSSDFARSILLRERKRLINEIDRKISMLGSFTNSRKNSMSDVSSALLRFVNQ